MYVHTLAPPCNWSGNEMGQLAVYETRLQAHMLYRLLICDALMPGKGNTSIVVAVLGASYRSRPTCYSWDFILARWLLIVLYIGEQCKYRVTSVQMRIFSSLSPRQVLWPTSSNKQLDQQ